MGAEELTDASSTYLRLKSHLEPVGLRRRKTMNASTGNRLKQKGARLWGRRDGISTAMRLGRRVAGAILAVLVIMVIAGQGELEAQSPVEGPWMRMDQIICFTNPTCTNQSVLDGTDVEYIADYGQRYEYGQERRRQCYYSGTDGPEAHEVNALFLMMACRIGIGVGGLAWIGTGIGLMALGWTAFRRSLEAFSTSGGGGTSALRAAIDVPIGILIMFMAFGLTALIYGVGRYNFIRYLNPDVWTTP